MFNCLFQSSRGCFTNVSRALQNNLAKIYNANNNIYGENFKLKLCTCAQSMALGTRTKFQLEILIRSAISAIHKFRENILESSRNVSETTPWITGTHFTNHVWAHNWNLMKLCFAHISDLINHSGRNFAHDTTAELSWHVQNCDAIGKSFFIKKQHKLFARFGLWAHELFAIPYNKKYYMV